MTGRSTEFLLHVRANLALARMQKCRNCVPAENNPQQIPENQSGPTLGRASGFRGSAARRGGRGASGVGACDALVEAIVAGVE